MILSGFWVVLFSLLLRQKRDDELLNISINILNKVTPDRNAPYLKIRLQWKQIKAFSQPKKLKKNEIYTFIPKAIFQKKYKDFWQFLKINYHHAKKPHLLKNDVKYSLKQILRNFNIFLRIFWWLIVLIM